MKKFTITSLLLLSITFLHAQTEKTDKFLIEKGAKTYGGRLSLGTSSEDYTRNDSKDESSGFSISLSPQLGFAIANNFILGAGITFGYSESNFLSINENANKQTRKYQSNSLGLFLFSEKYFALTKNLAFHLQAKISYRKRSTDVENIFNQNLNATQSNSKNNQFNIGLAPGFTFTLKEHLLLQANIGSLSYSNDNSTTTVPNDPDTTSINQNNNSFGLNLNPSYFSFGIVLVY